MQPPVQIILAVSTDDVEHARTLFREYAASLGFDLCFQGFDAELAHLPGDYAPPEGRLLLARVSGALAGCIALRKLEDGICEMKRLYVHPAFRGSGVGRALVDAILGEARQIGYGTMRLDTVPAMAAAIALYTSFGFVDIPPYRPNPIPGARYLELQM